MIYFFNIFNFLFLNQKQVFFFKNIDFALNIDFFQYRILWEPVLDMDERSDVKPPMEPVSPKTGYTTTTTILTELLWNFYG